MNDEKKLKVVLQIICKIENVWSCFNVSEDNFLFIKKEDMSSKRKLSGRPKIVTDKSYNMYPFNLSMTDNFMISILV